VSSLPEIPIGDRLRFYRTAQGKSQVVVAGLAGVTPDYLGQIERGLKTPTIAVLQRFASILGVQVSMLLGEPTFDEASAIHPVASSIQAALMSYGTSAANGELATLADLRKRVDGAWSIWQTSPRRFTEASEVLPELVVDVQRTVRAVRTDVDQFRTASQIAADLYFLLRTFTKRIGRADLSLLAADRGVLAAEDADDPVRIAAAKWNLGQILLAQGESRGAEDVAMTALSALPAPSKKDRETAAVYGALSLVATVAALRQGDGWTALDRLRQHALPAAQASGEGNVLWTVFGPMNVDLHAMSVDMERGEAGEALRLADGIDITQSPSLERQTTFYLEVARACEQRRDDAGVLVHLLNAEASGPEDMRYNPMARDLVRGLLKRARPTLAPQVRALASRIGLAA
jgi:transcriptional regulator with XRE-family HTH domain